MHCILQAFVPKGNGAWELPSYSGDARNASPAFGMTLERPRPSGATTFQPHPQTVDFKREKSVFHKMDEKKLSLA
jgi:hypothetical protein